MLGAPFPGGPSPITGSFEGSTSQTNTWTFTGLAFGPAAANRYIVAVLGFGSSSAVSSVTIGGIAATRVLNVANSTDQLQFWIAPVPTGTSGNVVTNGSGNGTMACSTYALAGTSTPNAPTAFTGTTTISQSVNIVAGSFVIAAGMTISGGASFVGTTLDHTQTQSALTLSTASAGFASGQNGVNLGVTMTGTSPVCGIAIWTP